MGKNSGQGFLKAILTTLASAMLIIALLVISIETFAVNQAFYESEYKKLGVADTIGIHEEDLSKTTKTLLDYTTDARDNLDIKAEIKGEMQEVFGQREKDHMVDVKALFLSARNVRTISLICAAVFIIAAFIIGRKRTTLTLCKSFLWVSGGFLIVVGALAVYAAVDFTSFWISFHQLFFTNNLWLLDPATDVLILMVPEQFFSDLVARIIIRFVSVFLTLNIAAIVGMLFYKKKSKKEVQA